MELRGFITQPVNARHRVCILVTLFVKIGVVGAYLPFVVDLFDHDDIGELGRVLDFSDEICFEELVHFLFDLFVSFFSHFPILCDIGLA